MVNFLKHIAFGIGYLIMLVGLLGVLGSGFYFLGVCKEVFQRGFPRNAKDFGLSVIFVIASLLIATIGVMIVRATGIDPGPMELPPG